MSLSTWSNFVSQIGVLYTEEKDKPIPEKSVETTNEKQSRFIYDLLVIIKQGINSHYKTSDGLRIRYPSTAPINKTEIVKAIDANIGIEFNGDELILLWRNKDEKPIEEIYNEEEKIGEKDLRKLKKMAVWL